MNFFKKICQVFVILFFGVSSLEHGDDWGKCPPHPEHSEYNVSLPTQLYSTGSSMTAPF